MPSIKTEGSVASHLSLLLVQVIFVTLPVAGKLALEGFARLAIAAWWVLVGAAFIILAASFSNLTVRNRTGISGICDKGR